MTQEGNSCTGHAVAAMVNDVLAQQERHRTRPHGQPLHALCAGPPLRRVRGRGGRGLLAARRTEGLVLPRRAARAGLAELDESREPDIDDAGHRRAARWQRPLGAFYRVNAFRLDDMQSAITELLRRSSRPRPSTRAGRQPTCRDAEGRAARSSRCTSSTRTARPRSLGGHAFCHRRLQRRRLPRAELLGSRVGPGRLRDPPVRRLAGVWLRRVGGPARRTARSSPQRSHSRTAPPLADGGVVDGARARPRRASTATSSTSATTAGSPPTGGSPARRPRSTASSTT